MEDSRFDLASYEEALRGGLADEQEVAETIEEMKSAKVGTIKADCWEKVSDNEFIIYSL